MSRQRSSRQTIPESFPTIEEAAEFWDNHDLSRFWAFTERVDFNIELEGGSHLVAIDPALAEKLAAEAHRRGLSTETLVNLWLRDKLEGSVA